MTQRHAGAAGPWAVAALPPTGAPLPGNAAPSFRTIGRAGFGEAHRPLSV
jgi:hypothetical protein